MSQVNQSATVGTLVAEQPGRSRVFEKLGIDYCCGGKRPLDQVCAEKSLDVDSVVARLIESDTSEKSEDSDWTTAPLSDLIESILATHHAYLKENLPRMTFLTEKVANAHGANHPEVREVAAVYAAMRDELTMHMMKEERILFPLIIQMEESGGGAGHCGGTIANPINVMEAEHQSAGDALEAFHKLTNDYTPPADACNTFRAMLHGLAELEQDLHQHIHKENNILFPRALEMESEMAGQAS